MSNPLSPKWDMSSNDGELVDDASRFGGDAKASKAAYENGMYRAFVASKNALVDSGRLVVVFANKEPDAWETLVSAVVRAGFVVDGSWPIRTELGNRTRAHASAALASSVWLVSKKRGSTARPGWDTEVRAEMQQRIAAQLTTFWDAGIRGPDFVWSAIGPALEAYSAHPIVKKADAPGEVLSVSEFLAEVRRIVVEFVVGRVLGSEREEVAGLDPLTTYYLLHRHDFKFEKVPVGASILYAISCGLRDTDLIDRYELLARSGGSGAESDDDSGDEEVDDADDAEATAGLSGSKVRLLRWSERRRTLRSSAREGGPLIDHIHQLLHLWKAGDQEKVNTFVAVHGLGTSVIFRHVLQALIELSEPGDSERALLEAISNHVGIELPSRRDIGLFEPV